MIHVHICQNLENHLNMYPYYITPKHGNKVREVQNIYLFYFLHYIKLQSKGNTKQLFIIFISTAVILVSLTTCRAFSITIIIIRLLFQCPGYRELFILKQRYCSIVQGIKNYSFDIDIPSCIYFTESISLLWVCLVFD